MRHNRCRHATGLLLTALMLLWLGPSPATAAPSPVSALKLSPVLFSSAPAPAVRVTPRGLPLRIASSLRSSQIRLALDHGRSLLGVDYRFGADTLEAVDCSSLVQRMFGAAGMAVPRTTRLQIRVGRAIDYAERRAGDLLFYRWGPSGLHVAVALDERRILHASTGAGEVVVSDLTPAWHRRLVGARRLI